VPRIRQPTRTDPAFVQAEACGNAIQLYAEPITEETRHEPPLESNCRVTIGDGGSTGVTDELGVLAGPSPAEFVATTLNVYEMPFVNPCTVHEVATDVVHVKPPGLDVTVYPVIVDPPSLAGAAHDTSAWPLPGDAVTPVGAPGAPTGVTGADADDAGPSPAPLVATTANV
jgi:hypothetical protein